MDTKVDYNVNSKFNLAGTFGVLHFKTSVPTVFGEEAIGQPIGGSSNPGHGHGNIYRTTVMGTYIFSPTFLMDAHFGFAKQVTNSEQPGLGTNIGSDVLGIPGTNGTRLFESGWPTFEFEGRDFATVGVNENFMPYYRHDPQSQYVVNFNWMKNKHNIRFGADFYRMGLNHAQAEFITGGFGAQGGFGFDRGITERCEVVDPASGNCQQTSDGSRSNSAAAFVLGQASRAGRTLQVPDEYQRAGTTRSASTSATGGPSATTSRSTTARGGSTSRFRPGPTAASSGTTPPPTRCCSAASATYPPTAASRRARRSSPRAWAWPIASATQWVVRAGYGLTNDPYYGMEIVRANYPILTQLNLESPDGLTPVGDAGTGGFPRFTVPDPGQRHHRHPEQLCVGRLPAGSEPRVHPVVELHGPAGAAVEVHGPDRVRGHALDTAARAQRHQCRPGHRRR